MAYMGERARKTRITELFGFREKYETNARREKIPMFKIIRFMGMLIKGVYHV